MTGFGSNMGRRPRLPQPPLELLKLCNVSSVLLVLAFRTCFLDLPAKVIILSKQNVNFSANMSRRPRLPPPPLELLRLCNVSSFLHVFAFCLCFTDSPPKMIILSKQNVNFWVEHGSTPPPPPTPLRAPQTAQCVLFAYFFILHVFYRGRCKSDHFVEVE